MPSSRCRSSPSSQPLESLGKPRGHASLWPAGAWGGWGLVTLGSPGGCLGLSGSQQSGRGRAPQPPAELGPPGPETQPDSTPRPPPPARAHGGSPASARRTVTTRSPGSPRAPPWATGGNRGRVRRLQRSRLLPAPELWDPPPPRGCPDCVLRPQRGGRVDMGAVPRRSRSSQPAEQSQGRARWARMPGVGHGLEEPHPSRGVGVPDFPRASTHAESAAGRGCGGHQRGPGCGLGLLATLRVPALQGPSALSSRRGRWGWPHGLRGTYQSARHHRVREEAFPRPLALKSKQATCWVSRGGGGRRAGIL